jgi:hypothetical protein
MTMIVTQDTAMSDKATSSEGEKVSEIEALASKVAQLSADADFWNRAMVWGLVAAALAAVFIVITTRLAIVRASQASEAQSELEKAKDRQLTLELKRRDENIANLETEALRLRQQLLVQGARENLITGENRRKLVDALKPFSGQQVDVRRSVFPFMVKGKIVSITPIGDDTVGLAEALLGVVKDAGWLAPPSVLPWGIQETGISVEITDAASASTRSAADALVRVLHSLSLSVSGPRVLPLGSDRFARVGTVEQATPPLLGKDTILLGVLTHPK